MSEITYLNFDQIDPEAFLPIVNEDTLRRHLVDHPQFDPHSVREWIQGKTETDAMDGCRVRAVVVEGTLAGWCGIQPDDNGFEIAIVLSKAFWGVGIVIFKDMMGWAKALGHKEVMFHLLETRAEYKSLKRLASHVQKTELMGRSFTTYVISVHKWRGR